VHGRILAKTDRQSLHTLTTRALPLKSCIILSCRSAFGSGAPGVTRVSQWLVLMV
jgi:hypothetical protein